jgi:hypothetical protein
MDLDIALTVLIYAGFAWSAAYLYVIVASWRRQAAAELKRDLQHQALWTVQNRGRSNTPASG